MSETTKTEEPRDFSTPAVEVCEVARFDSDGHLTGIGNQDESGVSNPAVAANESTAHPDAE